VNINAYFGMILFCGKIHIIQNLVIKFLGKCAKIKRNWRMISHGKEKTQNLCFVRAK
jgi:hypothetical protein